MLKLRVIPCLDVADGRVVKGVNFVDLRDAGDPVEQAALYDAAGADELTFLDITASHERRDTMLDVVARTAEYHSLTPDIGSEYARRVLAVWAKPATRQAPIEAPTQQASLQPWAPSLPQPASATLSSGSNARIIPLPSPVEGMPGVPAGRGLAAYRAAPTRLAARIMPGRPT